MKRKHLLKLYISGEGPRSESSVQNLHRICEEYFRGECDIVVIDLLERPHLAADEKILATPMLVREYPLPPRRIIGDLSDTERVVQALGLSAPDCVEPGKGNPAADRSNDDNSGGPGF